MVSIYSLPLCFHRSMNFVMYNTIRCESKGFVIFLCHFIRILFGFDKEFMQSWLSWNSVCRWCPLTQRSSCLCIMSAGNKGVHHHTWQQYEFLDVEQDKCFYYTFYQRLETWLSGKEHWLLFQKTSVQFPKHAWQFTMVCNSSFRGSDDPFCTLSVQGIHVVHIHSYRQNIHTH